MGAGQIGGIATLRNIMGVGEFDCKPMAGAVAGAECKRPIRKVRRVIYQDENKLLKTWLRPLYGEYDNEENKNKTWLYVDIDFNNAAGFSGVKADIIEAHYIVYFLSHAMMFCAGALIEAHVVVTPAGCVYGEKYKFEVFGGTHTFLEHSGNPRLVEHICIHRGYNHTMRWLHCSSDNLALLVLGQQYYFHKREVGTEFIVNRVRYGAVGAQDDNGIYNKNCKFYGWGSRRNGYLIPLLIHIRRVDVDILPRDRCLEMWNFEDKFLCLSRPQCKSEKHGALCPDDLGSVLVCSGFLRGIMTSHLMDRPCGVGFLDLSKYHKFLTCGVDDSRDVLVHEEYMNVEISPVHHPMTPAVIVAERTNDNVTLSQEELEPDLPPAEVQVEDTRF